MTDFENILITPEEVQKIKSIAPSTALPLSPTSGGFSSENVRRLLDLYAIGNKDSILALLIDRLTKIKSFFDGINTNIEDIYNNLVQEINVGSKATEIPSAKAVFDLIIQELSANSPSDKVASAKEVYDFVNASLTNVINEIVDGNEVSGKYVSAILQVGNKITVYHKDLPQGFSGNYNDLTNLPDVYTKSETDAKFVLQVAGMGLSERSFTQEEKEKLASLEDSKFAGQFISYEALVLAVPIGVIGGYAYVDAGVGSKVQKYIWDSSDNKWELSGDVNQELTPAQVKALYESNDNTNAFTDDDKEKLDTLEPVVLPTKLSELENDTHFITSGDIPESLSDFANDVGFITSGDIPENLSDFNNDTGFITSVPNVEVSDATETEGKYISKLEIDATNKHKLIVTKENLPTGFSGGWELTIKEGF